MATIRRLPAPDVPDTDTLLARLAHLLKLEVELGWAEVRDRLLSAAIAVAIAGAAAVALIASLVMLVAGAVAPLFGTRWEHLVIAGGGTFLLGTAAMVWSVWRLRSLTWPKETLTSLEENWRWLAGQVRSRLTLR